jgi:HD-GYP domain-containing protein (c-di-GMP phosphodiesterase class II)
MVVAAAACMLLGYQVLPHRPADLSLWPTAGLAAVGSLAWALSHRLGKASIGSVAFIPWLSCVLLTPTWLSPAFIGVAVMAGELSRLGKTQSVKIAFNVSQYVVAFSMATAAYVWFGGISIALDESIRVAPLAFAAVTFFLLNSVGVAFVVSLSESVSFADIWRRNTKGSMVNDLLSVPVVFAFAVVANRFGVAGIAFIGALMIGLRQLYKVNAALETTNRELLEVLVHAIELRDPYTSGHSQRVARSSRKIGRLVGLSSRQVERLEIAALLHDVGKIDRSFLPLLSNPGRLTIEERALMELHPIKSAELVAKVSELADVVNPVRHHHEAWDGSGYPHGLRGAEIPVFSRVIAIADTIDAMLTDRPYREALGKDEVRRELARCSGTQFDPSMCSALLSNPLLEEILGLPSTPALLPVGRSGDRIVNVGETALA